MHRVSKTDILVWVVCASTLPLLLYFGAATIVDAEGVEHQLRLVDVWWRLADQMPEWGSVRPGLAYMAIGLVLLAGFAAALWLCVTSGSPSEMHDDPPEPSGDLASSGPGGERHAVASSAVAPVSSRGVEWSRRGFEVAVAWRSTWWSVALLLPLAVGVAYRIGAFALWGTVEGPNGDIWLPNTYAAIDHPFHIARAETLRRALAEGVLPRWIGHHQGGYPAEFYPLGVAWLEVAVWAMLAGLLPIAAIHKIVVTGIFLAPGLAFALMARRDRLAPGLALLAFALHVLLPGGPWQGGYTELVQMGLVTNVAAAVAVLFVLLCLTSYLERRRPIAAVAAALAAAFAVFCNPRSLIGLAAIGVGAGLIDAWAGVAARPSMATTARRLAVVACLSLLLAAPELGPLFRFRELYEFILYTWYESPAEYVYASFEAVSVPVFILGVAGFLAAFRLPSGRVMQTVAVSWATYVCLTLVASSGVGNMLFPQLEATRLMPVQRLLTLYLAAFMGHHLLRRAWAWGMGPTRGNPDVLPLAAAAGLSILAVAPEPFGLTNRALYFVQTSAVPQMADFAETVQHARDAAPAGTALLVLGSGFSTHQQLWAPLVVRGPFYYDDWLWFWQPHPVGPDVATTEVLDPVNGPALSREYLEHHGIGAVAVSGEAKTVAALSPDLVRRYSGPSGVYDAYEVRSPRKVISWPGGENIEVTLATERLEARGGSSGGVARISHNWFPRWRATVNGAPVDINRAADGYMTVPVPAGEVQLEITYSRDLLDWSCWAAAAAGWLLAGSMLLRRERRVHSARTRGSSSGR